MGTRSEFAGLDKRIRRLWKRIMIVLAALFIAIVLVQLLMMPDTTRILVMGMDYAVTPKGYVYKGAPSQSADVMLVVEIDAEARRTTFVQMPRDMMAYISPQLGWDKLNMAISEVGCRGTCNIVGNLLGRRVDHYVVLTIPDLIEFLEILEGGPISYTQNGPRSDGRPGTRAGGQVPMTAQEALSAVMERMGSDTDRRGHQQVFVEQLLQERKVLGPRRLFRLAVWARQVDMDLSLVQAAACAARILKSDSEWQEFPTTPLYLNGRSYVVPEAGGIGNPTHGYAPGPK